MITARAEYRMRIKSIGRTTHGLAFEATAINTRPKIIIMNITSDTIASAKRCPAVGCITASFHKSFCPRKLDVE